MRILILSWRDIHHPWAGGSEVNIQEMAKRWVKKGHDVTMLTAHHYGGSLGRNKEIIDGIKVIRVGGRYSIYFLIPLYYLLKFRSKTDVIVDVENAIPFFTPIFSNKPKYCLVNHIHKDIFFKEMKFPLDLIGYFAETKLMPLFYKNVPFITISKTTLNQLAALGIAKKNIKIVYAGLDQDVYKPSKDKFRKPTILYLGRLRRYKRVNILISLMKDILKKVKSAQLIIAGDGEDRPALERQVHKLGLQKQIKIVGYVNQTRKLELLQKSWVFVTPSLMEGWGLAVLEANACGTPAVTFKVPGLSESVINGVSGYLTEDAADMRRQIIRILEDDVNRAKLVKGALKHSSHFDWNKSSNKFLEILTRHVLNNQK